MLKVSKSLWYAKLESVYYTKIEYFNNIKHSILQILCIPTYSIVCTSLCTSHLCLCINLMCQQWISLNIKNLPVPTAGKAIDCALRFWASIKHLVIRVSQALFSASFCSEKVAFFASCAGIVASMWIIYFAERVPALLTHMPLSEPK